MQYYLTHVKHNFSGALTIPLTPADYEFQRYNVMKGIRQHFMNGMTPCTTYHEYVHKLRMQGNSLLELHKFLAGRLFVRRDLI